ncbi:hypothetical protein ACLM5H_22580 [Fredinandcohnia humi]
MLNKEGGVSLVIKKALFFILIIFVLSACSQQKSGEYENVREVVWDYIEAEGLDKTGFYNKVMWDRATVKKVNLEDKFKKFIDDTYGGEKIFLVSLDDKDVVASPTFLVDEDIKEVIGNIPGE